MANRIDKMQKPSVITLMSADFVARLPKNPLSIELSFKNASQSQILRLMDKYSANRLKNMPTQNFDKPSKTGKLQKPSYVKNVTGKPDSADKSRQVNALKQIIDSQSNEIAALGRVNAELQKALDDAAGQSVESMSSSDYTNNSSSENNNSSSNSSSNSSTNDSHDATSSAFASEEVKN